MSSLVSSLLSAPMQGEAPRYAAKVHHKMDLGYLRFDGQTAMTPIQIWDYTEKSMLLLCSEEFGRSFSASFTKLWGKFGDRYTIEGQKGVKGWIFSKQRFGDLSALLNDIGSGKVKGVEAKVYGSSSGSGMVPALATLSLSSQPSPTRAIQPPIGLQAPLQASVSAPIGGVTILGIPKPAPKTLVELMGAVFDRLETTTEGVSEDPVRGLIYICGPEASVQAWSSSNAADFSTLTVLQKPGSSRSLLIATRRPPIETEPSSEQVAAPSGSEPEVPRTQTLD